MNVEQVIARDRWRTWVYAGVDVEVDLARTNYDLTYTEQSEEDKEYDRKNIARLQAQLEFINERIATTEARLIAVAGNSEQME